MKKGGNVVTYYWKDDKSPDRLRDKLVYALGNANAISIVDGWTIEKTLPDGTSKVCGAFLTVRGPKVLVDVLSWLTNFTIGKTNKVSLTTDEKGTITTCDNIKT